MRSSYELLATCDTRLSQKSKTCVVAVADINEGNAGQLADEFGAIYIVFLLFKYTF